MSRRSRWPMAIALGACRRWHVRILAGVVVVWLIIGAIAAGQRGYYSRSSTNCAQAGTVAVTILAGPLNYVGVNPKAKCLIPKPSQ
jgi:hypothetical protein